jgi:NAD(P)-dependent dehydrogenase (short-subunit alcohol dehydrogenase family)
MNPDSPSPSPFGPVAAYAAGRADCPVTTQFAGRVAVVTGSTQGLGLATVERMLARGLSGAVLCGRNEEAGQAAAERLSSPAAKVLFQRTDLANLDDCAALLERAAAAFGTVDLLVNAAGITDRGGILDADRDLWERTFAINARAPFFLLQDFANRLIAAGKPGSVVNVASIMAHGGIPALTVYASAKAALVTTGKNAAFSLARHGIRVNTLTVGWMDTPAEDRTQKNYHDRPDGWQDEAGRELPAGRLLQPTEVARWIAHLAGPESGVMTGSVIDFDHGVVGVYDTTPLPAPLSEG